MRDVTSQRVEQFSNVFQALSRSFSNQNEPNEWGDDDRELDYFLSNVTERTCQLCHRKEQCWTRNFNTTYDYLKEIMTEMEEKEGSFQQSYIENGILIV